jgi:hypothetical protein
MSRLRLLVRPRRQRSEHGDNTEDDRARAGFDHAVFTKLAR